MWEKASTASVYLFAALVLGGGFLRGYLKNLRSDDEDESREKVDG